MLAGSGQVLDYHARLLADRERLAAFRQAIAATVRPGDVVVDVGAGTGILSAYACAAGAARVYAIESDPIAGLTADILSANGLDDRVRVLRGHSSTLELPELADVLVSETLWNLGIGEGLPGLVRDMRARVLVPEPRIVPGRFRVVVAPLSSERRWHSVGFWSGDIDGLRVEPARELAANSMLIASIASDELLGEGRAVGEIVLGAPEIERDLRGEAAWDLPAGAIVHGLAGWFDAELAPGVGLSNPPGSESSWRPVFLPVDPPLAVSRAGRLDVAFEALADGREIRWRLECDGAVRAQSSFRGRLLDAAWIRRRSPAARPGLSRQGRAAAAALAALGDGASRSDTDRILATDHGAAFPTEDDRTDFLEELTDRYCT